MRNVLALQALDLSSSDSLDAQPQFEILTESLSTLSYFCCTSTQTT